MGLLFTFRIGVVKSQVAISSELFGLALIFKFSSVDTGILHRCGMGLGQYQSSSKLISHGLGHLDAEKVMTSMKQL